MELHTGLCDWCEGCKEIEPVKIKRTCYNEYGNAYEEGFGISCEHLKMCLYLRKLWADADNRTDHK